MLKIFESHAFVHQLRFNGGTMNHSEQMLLFFVNFFHYSGTLKENATIKLLARRSGLRIPYPTEGFRRAIKIYYWIQNWNIPTVPDYHFVWEIREGHMRIVPIHIGSHGYIHHVRFSCLTVLKLYVFQV